MRKLWLQGLRPAMRSAYLCTLTATALALAARPARAQLSGELLTGQSGLTAGTQSPEGLLLSPSVYDYYARTLLGPRGQMLPVTEMLNVFQSQLLVAWVSPWKLLGGSYGAQLSLTVTSAKTDFPRLRVEKGSFGFADLYLKPMELGWHTPRADFICGFAFYAPTGRYEPGANNNSGQGMWDYELSAGFTAWLDEGRRLNLSTQAFYDLFSPKRGTGATKIRTGNILALQGGLGLQLLGGALNIGIPYSVHWKLTEDLLPPGHPIVALIAAAKDWVAAIGGEVDFSFGPHDAIGLRYLRDLDGVNVTIGNTWLLFYNHLFTFDGG